MGNGRSTFSDILSTSPLRIVLLGLDDAGKTTVLYRLKFDKYTDSIPTVGFNCERIRGSTGGIKGVNFLFWDVGGQERVRPLWRQYTRASDGIVYVVDSSDPEKFDEARVELSRTAYNPENVGVPIIVLANKQDLRASLTVEEVSQRMELSGLAPQHPWDVVGTCAVTGEGVDEAMDKLYEMILVRKKTLRKKKK